MTQQRKRVNILWMDDMLQQEPHWFERIQKYVQRTQGPVQFLTATRMENFAETLQDRHGCLPQDERYIDWIWLDVKIKHYKRDPSFEDLGFDDVPQNPLLVGAQILDLMQNCDHYSQQKAWLVPYRGRPTTLLTSLLDIRNDWQAVVSKEVRTQIHLFSALVKHLKHGADGLEPDQAFTDHVSQRITQIKGGWSAP